MSKRSPGSIASRKKGQEIHRAERERHKQKMAAKAEREKENDGIPTER